MGYMKGFMCKESGPTNLEPKISFLFNQRLVRQTSGATKLHHIFTQDVVTSSEISETNI
jgi:hypothetical protein